MSGAAIRSTSLLLFLAVALPCSADRATAERLTLEGDAAIKRQDIAGALKAYGEAVEADPKYAKAWGGRGYAKARMQQLTGSLEDYAVALEIDPSDLQIHIRRHSVLSALDRWAEAALVAELLLKAQPGNPDFLALHGLDLIHIGQVDTGLAEQRTAAGKGGPRANISYQGYAAQADWPAVERECRAVVAAGVLHYGIYQWLVTALVEQGKFADARNLIGEVRQRAMANTEPQLCEAYLLGTPEAGSLHDPDASLRALAAIEAQNLTIVVNVQARTLFLAGRTHQALEALSTRGHRTHFETLLWLGACQWKLGRLAEARATLADAWRLNPYLAAHAKRIEGLGEFVSSIERDLKDEAGPGADWRRLGFELATHLLTVAEIETLVRCYRFRKAEEEYVRLRDALKSQARRAEVDARIPEVRGMAGALAKLIDAVNHGKLKLKAKVAGIDLVLVKADPVAFQFTIPKGDGRFPWAFLDTALFCEFALQCGLTPEETLGLGCLAWDSGDPVLGTKLLEEAARKAPAQRKNVTAFVARKRGLDAPAEGFVLFRNAYVTRDEKENLEKGLVRFQGRWVTAEEKEKLSKGMIQVAGKWVPGDEKTLLQRGYVKHEGKWMTREDYDALRGAWSSAWTEETAHFTAKTNQGEAFARDLASVVEAAYGELKKFYDGAEPALPSGRKMTLYAFKSFEDYRKYCVEVRAEGQLNAAGFASSGSDVVAGWNKTGNEQQFLQTMVHEAAHLYYFRIAPKAAPPSWHAEGMATYFEGFSWDGKSYRFDFVSESRLPFARDAVKAGKHIPLADVFGGDALALINSDHNKALLFYAECWALNLYLTQTDNRAYREGYAAYRKAVAAGGSEPLSKFIPDVGQLERDWMRFVGGL
ncbi:MAG: hypothetical protein HYY18_07250 [Planctomycetes bacterium]|nr:hypothetical protein [Planctomycetota bacterium]